MSNNNIVVNGMKLTLTQNDYKAQGGQGIVYVKGNLAYKVYHSTQNMIPEMKIRELSTINIPNVLAPKDLIFSEKGDVIGFTMPYVDNTEFLTKLISKNFKDAHTISNDMIVDLVTKMLNTVKEIHKKGFIVGDYNEMNFLVDSKFTTVYNIDVDSYQTKNFPCTAIMDSVRDRRLPFGKFDELSDWFSWAVVTFQMFTGIHPYMGKHPLYKTTDLSARMEKRVSVFDSEVKVPKFCQDFSIIPTNLLEWYKKVFVDGFRSEPPIPGSITQVIQIVKNNYSQTNFDISVLCSFSDKIIYAEYVNGNQFIATKSTMYKNGKDLFKIANNTKIRMLSTNGIEQVFALFEQNSIKIVNNSGSELFTINADAYMISNNVLYTIHYSMLYENVLSSKYSIINLPKSVDNISPVFKMFDGVVVQNVFGQIRLSIPYKSGTCASIFIPEIDGYRIIDAKVISRFGEFIVEKDGKYDRVVLYFSNDFKSYDLTKICDVHMSSINMIVRQNGMKVSIVDNDTLEMMMDIQRGSRQIMDCPIDSTMMLVDGIDKVLALSDKEMLTVKVK